MGSRRGLVMEEVLMAQKTYNARVQSKRDKSANWTSENPVLLDGEIIIVDTSSGETRFKIGDGTKKYSQLPFEDEAVRSLVSGKVDKVSGKELSSNDYTDAEKTKLAGIATGANKTTVDSALSSSSANPVQNKVVNAALAGKADSDHTHAQYLQSVSTQEITAGDDLNDYRTPGTYVCRNGTISASVANLPFTGSGFILYVISAYALSVSQTTVMQIAIDAGGRNIVCIRRVDDEGAAEWTQVADISDITLGSVGVTATAAELNKLDGCTATTQELNYVDGVTSNIQAQLNGKAASNHTHNYLPLSGGTLSGTLKVEDTINGTDYQTRVSVVSSGNTYIGHFTDGTEDNYLLLSPTATTTKRPLAVSSGGTGAASASEARTNLGITPANIGAAVDDHDHEEYLSAITSNVIPNNSDLNDYITPGVYATRNSTATATIENCPVSGSGFMLYVVSPYATSLSSGSNVVQIIVNGGTGDTKYRRGSGTTWTDWKTFITEDAVSCETSEIKIGGTWVNGYSIYRKCGTLAQTFEPGEAYDIDMGTGPIGRVVRADVFIRENNAWRPANYPNRETDLIVSWLIVDSDTAPKLRILMGNQMNSNEVSWTIEYTKG